MPNAKTSQPLWRRLNQQDVGLLALSVAALAAHGLWSEAMPWTAVIAMVAGALLGAWLGRHRAGVSLGRNARDAAVVVQDIQTLHQAFGVLKQQVDATIRSSETAVISMMERMNRVHRNAHNLRERILVAVERSQALSSDSLDRAGQHGQAVSTLAQHQQRFEVSQAENQDRVRAVAGKVRGLAPLVEMIGQISRQTNLLAINASIEAARAGHEGAGFKVVAAEVRRLSSQTAEAARQITDGIGEAARTIDQAMANAQAMHGEGAAQQLGEIAQHMQLLGDTLADVVPYLGELSTNMDAGMASVTEDIINTLGDMQFQDINRQLLEQINTALTSLSDHFEQIYALIDGQAPPPPQLLEELLARWTDNYVMQSQHTAHARGTGQAAPTGDSPNAPPAALTLAPQQGERIELF
jgi:methyl-accepting chemotaxis protein